MDVAMVGLGRMGANMARRAIWIMLPYGDATQTAIDELTPLLDQGDVLIGGGNSPFNSAALFTRFRSRQQDTFSGKVPAALRNEFGGHAVKEKE